MTWSQERTESLEKLWLDGLSASQVAKQLGGVSRSAVLGKVHRLGLSERRPKSEKPKREVKARPSARREQRPMRAPSPPRQVTAPVQRSRYVEEGPGMATVHTLGAHMCKWPIGDPMSDGFTFCGRGRDDGPYCLEHARIAFQPRIQKPRKERVRPLRTSLSLKFLDY